jgi:hypothetical protein
MESFSAGSFLRGRVKFFYEFKTPDRGNFSENLYFASSLILKLNTFSELIWT